MSRELENQNVRFEVRSKIWFQAQGRHCFGSGLAGILSAIDETGSLSSAAKREKMSYRQAWKKIKIAEEHLGARLLSTKAGGAGGGGSILTNMGKEILALFTELSEKVIPFTEGQFERLKQPGNTNRRA